MLKIITEKKRKGKVGGKGGKHFPASASHIICVFGDICRSVWERPQEQPLYCARLFAKWWRVLCIVNRHNISKAMGVRNGYAVGQRSEFVNGNVSRMMRNEQNEYDRPEHLKQYCMGFRPPGHVMRAGKVVLPPLWSE